MRSSFVDAGWAEFWHRTGDNVEARKGLTEIEHSYDAKGRRFYPWLKDKRRTSLSWLFAHRYAIFFFADHKGSPSSFR